MKAMFIAIALFVSAISLLAQGDFAIGISAMSAATPDISISGITVTLDPQPIESVEMIEAFRQTTGDLSPFPPIPPSSDFQIQINQTGIQPAPEPSTFALGSLAVGLISLVRLKRRKNI